MVPSRIPVRYLIDNHFLEWLLKDKVLAAEIIEKLSNIHKMSEHHPLEHNIIFDADFKTTIKNTGVRGTVFLGAMHPVPHPNFLESEKDAISKLVRYSINLANKKPFKVTILTSQEKHSEYETNEHFSKEDLSSAVTIKSKDEAISHIKLIHNLYCLK